MREIPGVRARRTFARVALILITIATAASGPQPWIPKANAQPFGGVCQHVGKVKPKPGLTTEDKEFAFTFRGSVGPCDMSDGSARWGIEFGTGKASGNCATRTATAVWNIVWSTGKRTVIEASFNAAVNVINTSGTITKGDFAGGLFEDAHILSGFDPTACTTSKGVTEATYQGAFGIGKAE